MADAPSKLVQVVNPRGELVHVAETDLPTALDPKAGYRLPTDAEVQASAPEPKGHYETLREKGFGRVTSGLVAAMHPGGMLGAWNEAGLEGATGGLAQVGIAKGLEVANPDWAKAYTRELTALREAYPTTRAVGNVAGNIARDVALGAVGVPTISGSVEGAVGRGLGALGATGQSALSRAGMAALKYGAGAGVENAVIGATQELSEEMLGPTQLSAEKILAAGGESALTGFLFGAGLGAGGSLIKSGVKGAGRLAAETIANKADDLRGFANEQRWRAISPSKAFTEQAQQRVPGGVNKVGEVMREYGLTGKSLQHALEEGDPQSILAKTTAAKEEVGRALGELHATSPASIKAGDLLDEIETHIEPLRKKGGFDGMVRSLEEYKESLFDKVIRSAPSVEPGSPALSPDVALKRFRETAIPIQDAIFQRKALDELIYRGSNPLNLSPIKQELEAIRGGFEDRIVKAIDSAAKQAGDAEAGARLLKLKGDYQALSLIERAGEKSTSGAVSNRNVSLSGQIAGAAMLASGHGLLAVPTAFAHQAIKTRGNALAAHALDKLADLGEAMRTVRRTDTKLAAAARGLVGDGSGKATKILPGSRVPYRESEQLTAPSAAGSNRERGESLRNRYARAVEHVAALRANQGEIVRRASERQIANAPNLSAAIASTAVNSISYLISRLPPTLDRPSLGGRQQKPRQTEAEMRRFVTAYEAVQNPDRVLDNLAAGRVRREEIYALRDTSPELFAELQQRTLDDVARKEAEGRPLPYDQRLKLGILFDVPTDPSLEPATMQRLQAGLVDGTKDEQRPATRSPRRSDIQTDLNGIDRLEAM